MSEIINILNDLVAACLVCEAGYRAAAAAARSDVLQKLLEIYVDQHHRFAVELQTEAYLLGDNPGIGPYLRYRDTRPPGSFYSGDDDDIIAECCRGEQRTLPRYQEALQGTLPENLRSMISRQYARLNQTLDRLVSLQESVSPARVS